MNIQIRVEVPADKSKTYSQDTLVQLITDPEIVHAILATILAYEPNEPMIHKRDSDDAILDVLSRNKDALS